jgi:ribosomal protein S27E
MNLVESEEKEPVIEIISITSHKSFSRNCNHLYVSFDEDSFLLECDICKKVLTPTKWLTNIVRQQGRIKWEITELEKELKRLKSEIEKKNRCKCEHCGKLTKISKESL